MSMKRGVRFAGTPLAFSGHSAPGPYPSGVGVAAITGVDVAATGVVGTDVAVGATGVPPAGVAVGGVGVVVPGVGVGRGTSRLPSGFIRNHRPLCPSPLISPGAVSAEE
jgi:hypothetical protein